MPDKKDIPDMIDMFNPINEDISLAAQSLRRSLENNYIKRLYAAAKNEEDKTKHRPSREVLLLSALKNYSPPQSHKNFDACIKMLNMMSAFSNIKNSLENTSHIEMKSKKTPDGNSAALARMSEFIILKYFADSIKSDFQD
ncbi:MAG: hypothetical protein LKJ25_05470 [Clostridia bacterium]|jgi:hypothetical protein|nr:hypothetical protein [Clostridia bacterium]